MRHFVQMNKNKAFFCLYIKHQSFLLVFWECKVHISLPVEYNMLALAEMFHTLYEQRRRKIRAFEIQILSPTYHLIARI